MCKNMLFDFEQTIVLLEKKVADPRRCNQHFYYDNKATALSKLEPFHRKLEMPTAGCRLSCKI
jgi:hypothetical protein